MSWNDYYEFDYTIDRINGQWSMFNGQCSMVNVQCSMVNVQCSMFNVQCSPSRRDDISVAI
jgi:hypothetical protein